MKSKKKNVVIMITALVLFISGIVVMMLFRNRANSTIDTTTRGDIEITSVNSIGDKGLSPEERTDEEIMYDDKYPTVMIEDEENILLSFISEEGIPFTKKGEMICGIALTFKNNGFENISTVVVDAEKTKYENNRIYIVVQDKDNQNHFVSCMYDLPQAKFFYKYFEE